MKNLFDHRNIKYANTGVERFYKFLIFKQQVDYLLISNYVQGLALIIVSITKMRTILKKIC